jgi:hypothetical protein
MLCIIIIIIWMEYLFLYQIIFLWGLVPCSPYVLCFSADNFIGATNFLSAFHSKLLQLSWDKTKYTFPFLLTSYIINGIIVHTVPNECSASRAYSLPSQNMSGMTDEISILPSQL